MSESAASECAPGGVALSALCVIAGAIGLPGGLLVGRRTSEFHVPLWLSFLLAGAPVFSFGWYLWSGMFFFPKVPEWIQITWLALAALASAFWGALLGLAGAFRLEWIRYKRTA